jgi:sphingosine 1-phosphate receptor 3
MVLIAIWKNNKFHNRMYFFIGNLALCDLLAGIVYKVNILMSGKKTFSLSLTVWFLREGSMFVALGASTCSLLAIAIERHLTMIKMRPYDANKKHRVFLLIGMCWLFAFSLGALPILGWNCLQNFSDCSTILPLYSKKYIAFCISIFIAILVTIVILYARIYFLVKSSSRKVANHNNSERSMALLRMVVICSECVHRLLGPPFHPLPHRRGLQGEGVLYIVQGSVVHHVGCPQLCHEPYHLHVG